MNDQIYSLAEETQQYERVPKKKIREVRNNATKIEVPWARLFSILSVLLLIFFSVSGCDSKKTIVNGLDEKEANEIVVFLANKGIEAYKLQAHQAQGGGGSQQAVTFDIVVDSSKAVDAMAILNSNGLPRRRGQNLLNLFSSGGLVPSDMQEKIRFQAGLAEQIASTIRKIDGILDADVQLSFPEEDPLNPNAVKGQITASVYVKHQGVLDDPNSHLITKIRRLVASSIAGLNFDNVTVIADRARFSDDISPSARNKFPGEVDVVRVWGVIIARDSLTRFQVVFFTFSVLLFIFFVTTTWLLWKVAPLLKANGGIRALLSFSPFRDVMLEQTQKEEVTQVDSDQVAEKKDERQKVQENVES